SGICRCREAGALIDDGSVVMGEASAELLDDIRSVQVDSLAADFFEIGQKLMEVAGVDISGRTLYRTMVRFLRVRFSSNQKSLADPGEGDLSWPHLAIPSGLLLIHPPCRWWRRRLGFDWWR
ncbi:hypothetical protein ACWKSP_31925, partial [Micromonosporaceae bacterium Da 78-11]